MMRLRTGVLMLLLAGGPALAENMEVVVEILPSANVGFGKTIKMRVTSKRAGWLTVFDLRENGKMTTLFPGDCVRKNRKIRAGAMLEIPDPSYGCEFTATEPGSGQIIAVVSDENVGLEKLVPSVQTSAKQQRPQSRYRSIDVEGFGDEPQKPKAKPVIKNIAKRLLAASKNGAKGWSLGRVEYRVGQH